MTNAVHANRGHAVLEYKETSTGDVSLHDIMYMSDAVDDFGNVYADPQAHFEVDNLHVDVKGSGTIQFFAVDADGTATDELTDPIPLDDIGSPLDRPCQWYVPPQRDVAYTTVMDDPTDTVAVQLKARLMRGGFARSLNLAP